jgi:uncharacterized protein (DUF697 family)
MSALAGDVSSPANENGQSQTAEQAAAALLSNAVLTTLKGAGGAPDQQVSVAFLLGWQMAELYRPDQQRRTTPIDSSDLPGPNELTDLERNTLGFAQIAAGMKKLTPAVQASGSSLPNLADLKADLAHAGTDATQRAAELRKFHVQLLTQLSAADSRLGKAYALGRALADTCQKPIDAASARAELGHHRLETLRAWLDDLKTALPAHAGESVSSSLASWATWARQPGAQPDSDVRAILSHLREQGRLWRSLLSGEKAAVDMLGIDDYVTAATAVLRRTGKLARDFAVRHFILTFAVVGLFAGGIAVMLADKSGAASIVAGASGIVASLGLGWKGVGGSLGKAVGNLERPLWGGAIDARVTAAITLLPGQADKPTFRDRDPSEFPAAEPRPAGGLTTTAAH